MDSRGVPYLFASGVLNIFTWMTPANVDVGMKVITGLGAVIASWAAWRYYRAATKEKKLIIKKLEEEMKKE